MTFRTSPRCAKCQKCHRRPDTRRCEPRADLPQSRLPGVDDPEARCKHRRTPHITASGGIPALLSKDGNASRESAPTSVADFVSYPGRQPAETGPRRLHAIAWVLTMRKPPTYIHGTDAMASVPASAASEQIRISGRAMILPRVPPMREQNPISSSKPSTPRIVSRTSVPAIRSVPVRTDAPRETLPRLRSLQQCAEAHPGRSSTPRPRSQMPYAVPRSEAVQRDVHPLP